MSTRPNKPNRPIRVLHALSQRPDSTGSGIYIKAVMAEAHRHGYQNHLLAGLPCDEDENSLGLDACTASFVRFGGGDIDHAIVGMSDVMPYPSETFRALDPTRIARYKDCFARSLQSARDAFRPDLVHSHHLWIMSSAAREVFADRPLVVSSHGSDLRQFRNCPQLRDIVLPRCREIDAVLALGPGQRTEIHELYGIPLEKIHVTGAGFDRNMFRPGPRPDPDPIRIAYAGKLSRAKGVPWLLRALKNLAWPWHLDLVGSGSGPELETCLALARELGNRVTAHGAVAQRRLAEILGRSHVFVLPSFFEGLPLVLMEALSSGCHVVSTALPGVLELFAAGTDDIVTLVDLPAMRTIDEPKPEAESGFVHDLARALDRARHKVLAPGHDLGTAAEAVLAPRTWAGVFAGVDRMYKEVLKNRA